MEMEQSALPSPSFTPGEPDYRIDNKQKAQRVNNELNGICARR
jgi:hypothetical protein